MAIDDLLEELCGVHGVSGYEENIREIIRTKIEKSADEIVVDSMGNLLVWFNGRSDKRVMFAAHMDEKGFCVNRIRDNGLIEFSGITEVDVRGLPAQVLEILTKKGIVKGLVDAKLSFHKVDKPVEMDDLLIDIGAKTKEAVLKTGVDVGNPIAFEKGFYHFENDVVVSKALDNRAGIAAILKALQSLKQKPYTIVFAAVVQEEVGKRGAPVAASKVKPDAAVVVDIMNMDVLTMSSASFRSSHDLSRSLLGNGPMLEITPYTTASLRDKIIQLAKDANIPHQVTSAMLVGTDAEPIQRSLEGVATASMDIPVLHFHTPKLMACTKDVDNTAALLRLIMEDKQLLALGKA